MKKQSLFLAFIVVLVFSVPTFAENWVESGGVRIDLDQPPQYESVMASQGSQTKDELLVNPGFETGDLAPWYTGAWTVTTDDPHTGTYCALGEGNNWIRQDFAGIPVEEIVSITIWSRQPEAAIQAFDLYYTDGTYFEDIVWPAATWGQFDITSWLTPGKTLNGIRIWGYSGGGPDPDLTYIDDVSIMTVGQLALKVEPKEVSAWLGGTFKFTLDGGPDQGGKPYALFGSNSGATPGTVLPGGLVLGMNWDWFTDMLMNMALAGGYGLVNDFIGALDVDGRASASLIFPGHCQLFDDLTLTFAFCTYGPFDFVSNSVEATLLGAVLPPEGYFYDDGSSENALGWTAGGFAVWVHSFDSGTGDTIDEVSSTFGQAGSTSGPPNGDPIEVYVWTDPNQDGEPSDGVLIGKGSGVVANTGTNDFNHYALDVPTAVNGKFFVGCGLDTLAGTYAAPMDTGSSFGVAFFTGAYIGSGLTWDPTNMGGFVHYEMGSIGFPCVWMLRANDM